MVTKIIANRIKPFLNDLISPHQTSFLKGRRACDSAILVQEMMTRIKNTKNHKGCLILKLDLEKAFDKLKWSFLKITLHHFKFPPNISRIIMSCMSSSNIVVLVNGTRTDFFSPSSHKTKWSHVSIYHYPLHGIPLIVYKLPSRYLAMETYNS